MQIHSNRSLAFRIKIHPRRPGTRPCAVPLPLSPLLHGVWRVVAWRARPWLLLREIRPRPRHGEPLRARPCQAGLVGPAAPRRGGRGLASLAGPCEPRPRPPVLPPPWLEGGRAGQGVRLGLGPGVRSHGGAGRGPPDWNQTVSSSARVVNGR